MINRVKEIDVSAIKEKAIALVQGLLGRKKNKSIAFNLNVPDSEIWFTREEIQDHVDNFGMGGFVRRGKTLKHRIEDEESLLLRVCVVPHNTAIYALCDAGAPKALWQMTMDALLQLQGNRVTVGDVQKHIHLAGLVALSQHDDVTLSVRGRIHQYLLSLPLYVEGVEPNVLPQETYEMHGSIAMTVWNAIREQIMV